MHLIQFDIGKRMKNYMIKLLNQKVSAYINYILSESNKTTLEELDISTLMKLRNAYELVNEHEEVENINRVLRASNSNYSKNLQFNPI